jgi:glutamyl-tRNA synthetase
MGLAYPCFCSEEELEGLRERQKALKENFGYYGKYAVCRNRPLEELSERLERGEGYVLRFRSGGDIKNRVRVYDAIRGEMELTENDQDFVLLKSDGIPTYHFAHAVDDHLMRTTHVVRGEEWLATLPIHAQLFDAFGWKRPVYCHTAQLMKMDGGSKRKLSKRKDPELALGFYRSEGYPVAAVWEYMLTVLNSNFEMWRDANPDKALEDFPFSLGNMSSSGALFDLVKLNDISRRVLSRLSAEAVYGELLKWAGEFDKDFAALLSRDAGYTLRALSVGRGGEKPRRDLCTWKQAKDFLSFYYDELFSIRDAWPENVSAEDRRAILADYIGAYRHGDDKSAWFDKVRSITDSRGYAVQPKKYKSSPESYKGSIIDVSNVIRLALVGLPSSPDLWEISQVLGEERVLRRLKAAAEL